MKADKRIALEAAGFRFGDAEDFLELSDEERRLVELRMALSAAVRKLRGKRKLTQQQLAARLKSSQSRVAKIENAAADVSLDLLFRSFFAVGGELSDLRIASRATKSAAAKTSSSKRAKQVFSATRV